MNVSEKDCDVDILRVVFADKIIIIGEYVALLVMLTDLDTHTDIYPKKIGSNVHTDIGSGII